MANTLTAVIPQLLAQALDYLREQAITPRLVNTEYKDEAKSKGDTIDIPIGSEGTVRDVTPAVTWATNQDMSPTKVQIELSQWKESTFYLTDKQREEVLDGVIPLEAKGRVKAIANTVDSFILGLYKGVYSAAGTAGTTPFSAGVTAFKDARTLMNKTLAPLDNRSVVLDPDAEGNAVVTTPFLKADERGDQGGVIEGNIGRKLGADWWMDQNVPTHTRGTLNVYTSVVTKAAYASGVTTVTLDRASLTGSLVTGDIFTLAGDSQQYVVAATATAASNAIALSIQPALKAAVASNVAATIVGSHVVNLLFHRDAIAWASRPLSKSQNDGLGSFMSMADPISGISLRLEVARQYKQTTYSFDILYGGKLVRPELAARIMG